MCVCVLVLHSWCFRVSPHHCCVLFSALWQICRLYTQKFAECLCFYQFPIHFLWSVIFQTEDHKSDNFFLRPLSLLESSPQFFCVFTFQMPLKSPSSVPFRWSCDLKKKKTIGQKLPKCTRGLRTFNIHGAFPLHKMFFIVEKDSLDH